jgi:glucosyl-dolichyl phosphate glucuronosyltransferase
MISVVICTYNRCEVLKQTLQSFAEMELPSGFSWELLVVDNNSTDATREFISSVAKESQLPLRYLFEERQGKTFALNAGVKEAKGEVLAFTDDDVRVDPRWLSRIKEAFDQSDCAGVGGKIVPLWSSPKPPWLVLEGAYKLNDIHGGYDLGGEVRQVTPKTTPFGANLAFRKTAFAKHGLFRTDLGPSANSQMPMEETEFCRRLMLGGENILYLPGVVVYHRVDKKLMTKKHFQNWYFAFGRSAIRLLGIPPGTVYYFGIPRFMLRTLVEELTRWLFAIDRRKRFFHKLKVYERMGEIQEARQMSGKGTPR